MAAARYLAVNGSGPGLTQVAGATTGGAPDADKIPSLDASGKLTASMMPVGIGADTATIITSEVIAAGAFVNIYNNAGTITCRNADNTSNKPADGFVLAGFASAATATVYFEGSNTALTGLTLGVTHYLGAGGAVTATIPTTATNIRQELGKAYTTTAMGTEIEAPITLA